MLKIWPYGHCNSYIYVYINNVNVVTKARVVLMAREKTRANAILMAKGKSRGLG